MGPWYFTNTGSEIRVYNFGIGEGSWGRRWMSPCGIEMWLGCEDMPCPSNVRIWLYQRKWERCSGRHEDNTYGVYAMSHNVWLHGVSHDFRTPFSMDVIPQFTSKKSTSETWNKSFWRERSYGWSRIHRFPSWIPSTSRLCMSSCCRTFPNPSASPVDRHKKNTSAFDVCSDARVGAKKRLSSSGWAVTSNTLGGEPVSFVRDLIWRNGLSWLIDSRRIKAKSRGTMTAKILVSIVV